MLRCDNCSKVGHKASDCWYKGSQKTSVTCYTCQQPGHYSSQCPNKGCTQNKNVKVEEVRKSGKKASVVNEKDNDNDNRNSMIVEVGGNQVKVLLDFGADISVIPSKYVAEADYTGEMVELTNFEGLVDRKRRIAVVRLSVGNKIFKERVAISDHLRSKGLLQFVGLLRRVVTLLGLLAPDDSKIVAATRVKVLSSYPRRTTEQSSG